MFILVVILAVLLAMYLLALLNAFIIAYGAVKNSRQPLNRLTIGLPLGMLLLHYHFGFPPVHFWSVHILQLTVAYSLMAIIVSTASFTNVRQSKEIQRVAVLFSAVAMPLAILPWVLTIIFGRSEFARLPSFKDENISPMPISACIQNSAVEYVHLSDLHFTGGKPFTVDREPAGETRMSEILTAMSVLHPKFVVVSGDITDTGTQDAWSSAHKFFEAISRVSGAQIILSPGNHDFSPAFVDQNAGQFNDNTIRTLSFLAEASSVTPRLKTVSDEFIANWFHDSLPIPNLQMANRQQTRIDGCITWCANANARSPGTCADPELYCKALNDHSEIDRFENYGKYWNPFIHRAFPLQYRDKERTFVILATSLDSDTILSHNALGDIDDDQIDRLAKLLQELSDPSVLYVVLHHPLVRPESDRFRFPIWGTLREWEDSTAWAYTFLRLRHDRAEKVLSMIEQFGRAHPGTTIFVLFGHRHVNSFGYRSYKVGAGNIQQITVEEEGNLTASPFGFFIKYNGAVRPVWCELNTTGINH